MTQEQLTIFTIEEVIARSVPSWWKTGITPFSSETLRSFLEKRPGYFGVSPGMGGFESFGGLAIPLPVDLDEYLTVYRDLMTNPKKIYGYFQLLDPEIRERVKPYLVEHNPNTRDKPEIRLINALFGVGDHSGIGWSYDPAKAAELKVSLDQNVLPLFREIPVLSKTGESELLYRTFEVTENPDKPGRWIVERPIFCILHKSYLDDGGMDLSHDILDTSTSPKMFDALETTLRALMRCEEIEELNFHLGDAACMTPIYRRKS